MMLYLNFGADRIALITGPNMGGKSTYLRQAALIVILAQMGSWVPATAASLPLIDRVFTRIGASDNLARGRSTFMVGMTETRSFSTQATPRSFIILDEIGRGTATYDGLSLAWAVVEHISSVTGARTLFATHYHELTELAGQLDGVRNLSVSVKEAGDRIIFLHKVEPGKADRSYGIEVARLAGLPAAVIDRARQVLRQHEIMPSQRFYPTKSTTSISSSKSMCSNPISERPRAAIWREHRPKRTTQTGPVRQRSPTNHYKNAMPQVCSNSPSATETIRELRAPKARSYLN